MELAALQEVGIPGSTSVIFKRRQRKWRERFKCGNVIKYMGII